MHVPRRPTVSSSHAVDRWIGEPRYRAYASYEDRLSSFKMWPVKMQLGKQLARAGFFYTGSSNKTTCYHCGLSVYNWQPEENPLKRHSINSPRCKYVIRMLMLSENAQIYPISNVSEQNFVDLVRWRFVHLWKIYDRAMAEERYNDGDEIIKIYQKWCNNNLN